jgi:hypothetical protein
VDKLVSTTPRWSGSILCERPGRWWARNLVPYFDAHVQFVDWLLGYFSGFDPYLTARLLAGTPIGAHLPGHIRAQHGASSDRIGEFGRPDR